MHLAARKKKREPALAPRRMRLSPGMTVSPSSEALSAARAGDLSTIADVAGLGRAETGQSPGMEETREERDVPDEAVLEEDEESVPRRVPEPEEPADPGVPGRDDPEPVGPGA